MNILEEITNTYVEKKINEEINLRAECIADILTKRYPESAELINKILFDKKYAEELRQEDKLRDYYQAFGYIKKGDF